MKIMAVDYGESRTGIAVSDVTEFLASPVGIIKEKNTLKAIEKIAAQAKELGAQMIVIGNPVNMDGTAVNAAKNAPLWPKRLQSWWMCPLKCGTSAQQQKQR